MSGKQARGTVEGYQEARRLRAEQRALVYARLKKCAAYDRELNSTQLARRFGVDQRTARDLANEARR